MYKCITFVHTRACVRVCVCIETILYPRDKYHIIMVYDTFNVLLNSVCLCLVEDIYIYVHQEYWSVIFYFYSLLVYLWYKGDAGLIK